ncbi:hypothetical protein CDV31_005625 [Fusarium ambrosium]|uniref:Uncharacterized protein n=1 Tax=Fusarium ambrosium TaxID=131363 RepID=A0A428UHV7_9HYPO|nr:hypothetical protein CDV31_005625 [Fusarium ambrosium]
MEGPQRAPFTMMHPKRLFTGSKKGIDRGRVGVGNEITRKGHRGAAVVAGGDE